MIALYRRIEQHALEAVADLDKLVALVHTAARQAVGTSICHASGILPWPAVAWSKRISWH